MMRAAKKVLGGLGVFLFVANSAIAAPPMRGGIPQDIEDLREAIAELQDRTAELEQTFPIGLVNIVRSLCRYISAQGLPPTEACEPYLGFFPTKTVFVTSQTFNGNLGGLGGADAKCQELADSSSIVTGTYKAWLSTEGLDARDRMEQNPGPYRLSNGALVALSWDDFVDGSHSSPIHRTEEGVPPSSGNTVWTATTPEGTLTDFAGTCADWTDSEAYGAANMGLFYFQDTNWTQASGSVCSSSKRLYCIEQ